MASRFTNPVESPVWQDKLQKAKQIAIGDEFFETFPAYKGAKTICLMLTHAGHVAWLAGGCVRDLLLRREPKDFDIVTSAPPEEVQDLFVKTEAVGKAFGVILVVEEGEVYDVATFRSDGAYVDGRRPEAVSWSTPEEDAMRRDFTVNALFYDPTKKIIYDFVSGLQDLKGKRLRAVGDPKKRFAEDHLRILRSLRFYSELQFKLEPDLAEAALALAPGLKQISAERIKEEMIRLLEGPGAFDALQEVLRLELTRWVLLPDSAQAISLSAELWSFWETTPQRGVVKLFCIWLLASHDQPELALKWMKAWPFANREKQIWRDLSEAYLQTPSFHGYSTAQKMLRVQNASYETGVLWRSHVLRLSANASAEAREKQDEVFAAYMRSREYYRVQLQSKLPAPYLNGEDVLFLKGPERGKALDEAYSMQLEGHLQNRDQAVHWVRQRFC